MTKQEAKEKRDLALQFANSGYVINPDVAKAMRERAEEAYQRDLRSASDAAGVGKP